MAHPKGGTVFVGRDNTLDWQLTEDDAPLPPDKALAITRARLESDIVSLDSADDPGLVAGLGTDTLSWRLGHVPELVGLAGQDIAMRLVVFSTDYPAGLVWVPAIQVAVR